MREHNINSKCNFLQGYYIDNDTIIDGVIKHFNNQKKVKGLSGDNGVNKKVKDSLDVHVLPREIPLYNDLVDYYNELAKCLNEYKKKYLFSYKDKEHFKINDNSNIQMYKPGGGYHAWHCERQTLDSADRHLVFMTYLNDVKQGGETEFYYQKIKVKPEKGLTLIWSADWTFTHRGNTTIDENKYIITGWDHFTK